MPQTSRRARSLEEECQGLVTKWFERTVETGGGGTDFSNTSVLQWWRRYQHKYPDIVGLAKRQLFAQASSATSERAFSKAGLVISKKRQRLTPDHVDSISLLGWRYKDSRWGESSKRLWCVPQVEGQRLEDEREIAAQQGLKTRGGILKTIVVHMRYDPWSSTGSERADASIQILLRLTMDSLPVHI